MLNQTGTVRINGDEVRDIEIERIGVTKDGADFLVLTGGGVIVTEDLIDLAAALEVLALKISKAVALTPGAAVLWNREAHTVGITNAERVALAGEADYKIAVGQQIRDAEKARRDEVAALEEALAVESQPFDVGTAPDIEGRDV